MKRLFLILLSLLVLACNEDDFKSLNGRWKLAHFYNLETGISDKSSFAGNSIILTFSDDGRSGTISGNDITNPVIGVYELGQHSRITFTPFDILARDEWSKNILIQFATADFVKVSDNTLSITCNRGKEVLLFVKDE
ncbi:MAG TPA: hypothetical protein VFW11_20280 [Cyclobacteriaceae bacterium]|nr:hypothetical protein [Cyclobacteriaceae bacterium]